MEGSQNKDSPDAECPICGKYFETNAIEVHVNRCIFLNSHDEVTPSKDTTNKRSFSIFAGSQSNASVTAAAEGSGAVAKKKSKNTTNSANSKIESPSSSTKSLQSRSSLSAPVTSSSSDANKATTQQTNTSTVNNIPLAEKMRPETIEQYIGQSHVMGKNAILRKILDKNETPSMILWGPPGVGK